MLLLCNCNSYSCKIKTYCFISLSPPLSTCTSVVQIQTLIETPYRYTFWWCLTVSNLKLSYEQGDISRASTNFKCFCYNSILIKMIDNLSLNMSVESARSMVEHGCSLSVMSYITFATIAANTVININNVSKLIKLSIWNCRKWKR